MSSAPLLAETTLGHREGPNSTLLHARHPALKPCHLHGGTPAQVRGSMKHWPASSSSQSCGELGGRQDRGPPGTEGRAWRGGLPWAKGTEMRDLSPHAHGWVASGRPPGENDSLSFDRGMPAETGQLKATPAIPSQNSSWVPRRLPPAPLRPPHVGARREGAIWAPFWPRGSRLGRGDIHS